MENEVVVRKKKEKVGIFAGLACMLLATILLFYNESRAVDSRKVIGIAKDELIEVSSSVIDQNNEGKLIVTSGKINLINDMVYDEEFNVGVKSAKLNRIVEMYQWYEDCDDEASGKEKCTYSKKWSSSIIDDSKFESGHNNPDQMPYEDKTIIMSNVKLGEFKLSSELLEQLSTTNIYNELSESVASSRNMYVIDGYYTTYYKDEEIEVGDVRISFKYNDASDVSVMGVQNNSSFIEFKTDKNNYSILKLEEKILNGKEFIKELDSENNVLTWVFRLVGTIFMIAGITCILSLIKYLASYIPFLGKIVINAVFIVSILVGLSLSLLIISVSWLLVRPLLSVILFVLIGGLVFLIIKLNKKKEIKNEAL